MIHHHKLGAQDLVHLAQLATFKLLVFWEWTASVTWNDESSLSWRLHYSFLPNEVVKKDNLHYFMSIGATEKFLLLLLLKTMSSKEGSASIFEYCSLINWWKLLVEISSWEPEVSKIFPRTFGNSSPVYVEPPYYYKEREFCSDTIVSSDESEQLARVMTVKGSAQWVMTENWHDH